MKISFTFSLGMIIAVALGSLFIRSHGGSIHAWLFLTIGLSIMAFGSGIGIGIARKSSASTSKETK